jgi:radical SAM superfamily enzyme YgiQ (UPF0313 family)
MGGGCRFFKNRETIYAGGRCENNCFSHYGGCNASYDIAIKQKETCEYKTDNHGIMLLSIDEINRMVEDHTRNSKTIFLYTPDLFSKFYFRNLFKKLPERNGNTYIAVNAGVKTLKQRKFPFEEIRSKGIFEIWIGVESADLYIRNKYGKPKFSNSDVKYITEEAKKHGIEVCWYLVDGKEDDSQSRLATYNLIRECKPFRVNIEQLQ